MNFTKSTTKTLFDTNSLRKRNEKTKKDRVACRLSTAEATTQESKQIKMQKEKKRQTKRKKKKIK